MLPWKVTHAIFRTANDGICIVRLTVLLNGQGGTSNTPRNKVEEDWWNLCSQPSHQIRNLGESLFLTHATLQFWDNRDKFLITCYFIWDEKVISWVWFCFQQDLMSRHKSLWDSPRQAELVCRQLGTFPSSLKMLTARYRFLPLFLNCIKIVLLSYWHLKQLLKLPHLNSNAGLLLFS